MTVPVGQVDSCRADSRPTLGNVKLLVSVRNAAEALEAVAGGADIIDVKEPERGPLGPANARVLQSVIDAVAGRCPVTAAAGELADWRGWLWPRRLLRQLTLVKVGLAGVAGSDFQVPLCAAQQALPSASSLVAVAYADNEQASAPLPEHLVPVAAVTAAKWVMIDTCTKNGKPLFQRLGQERVACFVRQAKEAGLQVALAGQLCVDSLPAAASLGADVVGVRGAACRGDRLGSIDRGAVAGLSDTLRSVRASQGSLPGASKKT